MNFDVFKESLDNKSNSPENTNFDPDQRLELNNNETNEKDNIGSSEQKSFDPDAKIEVPDLDKCLENFTLENWDKLDLFEGMSAIEDLKDSICIGLGIDSFVDLKWYYNEDNGDRGEYDPNTNEIRLNIVNIDDPKAMVRVLAHELRHAWQEQRINLPESIQTNFDKELKLNNENYIQPEDNYFAYRNQLIESDARIYASDIIDKLDGLGESYNG